MFNIGLGEVLVLLLVGLLVFGPDRLPRAVADATRTLRHVRRLAADARRDLGDAAGLDLEPAAELVAELRDLQPRRLLGSLVDGTSTSEAATATAPPARRPAAPAAAAPATTAPDAQAPAPSAFAARWSSAPDSPAPPVLRASDRQGTSSTAQPGAAEGAADAPVARFDPDAT